MHVLYSLGKLFYHCLWSRWHHKGTGFVPLFWRLRDDFLYFTVMVYYIKWSWEMKSIKTNPILSRYQIPFDVARFSLLVFCWSFCFFVHKILFITFPLLWCLGLYQNNIGPTNFVDFLHFSIFSTLLISVLILTISLLYFSSISDVWRECWG